MPRRTSPFVGGLDGWDCPDGHAYVRVSHCSVDQVLDLAYSWTPEWNDRDQEDFAILERGWYRTAPCQPNICGDHRYHLNRSKGGRPGAFYAWLLGVRWVRP